MAKPINRRAFLRRLLLSAGGVALSGCRDRPSPRRGTDQITILHVNDFHATILHLLGLDHEALTFKFQGRNFRLTDVGGAVAEQIIA